MNTKLMTAMSLAMLAAACASTPKPNAALESARSAVEATEADPNAAKFAATDVDAAKKELQAADAAALRHDDPAMTQAIHLATSTARLAQLRGAAKADDARVAAGQTERDQIQLSARTREVESANAARNKAAAESASLLAQVDALKATKTDRGLVLTLGDVLFDTGKANWNPGAAGKLDQLVTFLTQHPDRRVQIDGFTDNVGSESSNVSLSQRRADVVRMALQSRGIDPTRISSHGYGEEFPVASNAEASGRQMNRRVEIVIGGDNGGTVADRGR